MKKSRPRKAIANPRAKPARAETADEILDVAETLIQTRGYSAFSYQDIADALGIHKASIHYHFASKTDLGVAVVDRYVKRFGAALAAVAADQSKSSMTMLNHYVEPYLAFADTPDRACLCGALASEMMVLPAEIRRRVDGSSGRTRPGLRASSNAASRAVRSRSTRRPPRPRG
jgi:TetR/AcrR family transcriptional regulator, transcriptional repressor for nem operon